MADQTQAQKAEQDRKAEEERKRREGAAKQFKPTSNQTPTTPPGGKVTKPLAYTPGPRTAQQEGDPRGDTSLSPEEIKSLAGGISPGEVGWVKLDEEGKPVGTVSKDLPPLDGEPVARVVGSPTHKYDEIVTPSGAPVSRYMNPDPVLWDEGMLARNPIPQEEQAKANEHGKHFGSPVINKPGTV